MRRHDLAAFALPLTNSLRTGSFKVHTLKALEPEKAVVPTERKEPAVRVKKQTKAKGVVTKAFTDRLARESRECVVCCETRSASGCVACPSKHSTCASCFKSLFEASVRRTVNELTPQEVSSSRFMVCCTSTAGCGLPFSFKATATALSDDDVWK